MNLLNRILSAFSPKPTSRGVVTLAFDASQIEAGAVADALRQFRTNDRYKGLVLEILRHADISHNGAEGDKTAKFKRLADAAKDTHHNAPQSL